MTSGHNSTAESCRVKSNVGGIFILVYRVLVQVINAAKASDKRAIKDY